MRANFLGLVLILTLVASSCGNQSATESDPKNEAVTNTNLILIKTSTPSAGAKGVSIDSDILVNLDDRVLLSTIDVNNIQVMEDGSVVPVEIEIRENELIIKPAKLFNYSALVTVSLANLTSIDGSTFNSIASFSFTTEKEPDTAFPFIVSSIPEDGAVDVSVNTAISVQVNESIQQNINAALTDDLGNLINGDLIYTQENLSVTFVPSVDLSYNTLVTFSLPEVLDQGGNKSNLSISFTTSEKPDVIAPSAGSLVAVSGTRGTLSWTATGDDGISGKAAYYSMKRAEHPINNIEEFNLAEAVSGMPAPRNSGEVETFVIPALGINKTEYIALRIFDEAGNGSEMSTAVINTTSSNSFILEAGASVLANDYFGYTISGNCDLNNDGLADYIVGSPYDDIAGVDTGRVFIYPFNQIINGIDSHASNANDLFGYSISCAQDFNGDGLDDLLIGAPFEDTLDGSILAANSGAAYLFYGREFDGSSVLTANSADIIFQGRIANDRFGNKVAGIGDINNDGLDDIAITAPWGEVIQTDEGVIYIYYGKNLASGSKVYDINADVIIAGVSAGNSGGLYGTVKSADVDGDEIKDLALISATYPTTNKGTVYLLLGKNGIPSFIDLSTTTPDVTISGKNNDDYLGTFAAQYPSVSIDGDINNDGINDLVIGAANFDPLNMANAGSVFVFFGRSEWSASYVIDNVDLTINGVQAGDLVGASVDTAGDYNYDGISDLLIGASKFATGGGKGGAFVFYGRENFPLSMSIISADVIISQSGYAYADIKLDNLHADDYLGRPAIFAGDTNGDFYDDILLGAYGNEIAGGPANAGAAFLVW